MIFDSDGRESKHIIGYSYLILAQTNHLWKNQDPSPLFQATTLKLISQATDLYLGGYLREVTSVNFLIRDPTSLTSIACPSSMPTSLHLPSINHCSTSLNSMVCRLPLQVFSVDPIMNVTVFSSRIDDRMWCHTPCDGCQRPFSRGRARCWMCSMPSMSCIRV